MLYIVLGGAVRFSLLSGHPESRVSTTCVYYLTVLGFLY